MRNDTGAVQGVVRERHTWIMAFLYIGTFGSFIGYSFAFGLVLQTQFGRTPLQAASITFIGPLLGSLIRPVGGRLADRFGGARITLFNFVGMVAASAVVLAGSAAKSLRGLPLGFIAPVRADRARQRLDVQDDPGIFHGKALAANGLGGDERAQRYGPAASPVPRSGIIGAVGALGGVLINLAFRQSFLTAGTGDPAFGAFLAFYVACIAVDLGRIPAARAGRRLAPAGGLRAGLTRQVDTPGNTADPSRSPAATTMDLVAVVPLTGPRSGTRSADHAAGGCERTA